MGYFGNLVLPPGQPDYDVIYAGTLRRRGLPQALLHLARLGLRVAVVSPDRVELRHQGIEELGLLSLEATYEAYSRSRVGLNFIPIEAPYIYQDSTKLIEYNAAGLGTLTTRYPLVQEFEKMRKGRFLYWSLDLNAQEICDFDYTTADVTDLDWPVLLDATPLASQIRRMLSRGGV